MGFLTVTMVKKIKKVKKAKYKKPICFRHRQVDDLEKMVRYDLDSDTLSNEDVNILLQKMAKGSMTLDDYNKVMDMSIGSIQDAAIWLTSFSTEIAESFAESPPSNPETRRTIVGHISAIASVMSFLVAMSALTRPDATINLYKVIALIKDLDIVAPWKAESPNVHTNTWGAGEFEFAELPKKDDPKYNN